MDLSVPDTVDNRYKVLEVIGTGAMATVYALRILASAARLRLRFCARSRPRTIRSAHALSVRRRLWRL